MWRFNEWRVVGLSAISIVLGAGAFYWLTQTKQQLSGLPAQAQNSPALSSGPDRRMLLEGFSTVNYSANGKIASRLRLGKCELRTKPAAFWLFDAGPVLEMRDVQVDLFHWHSPDQVTSNPAAPESAEALESLYRLPRQFHWGSVGGLAVYTVAFNLYEDDQRATVIHAQRMTPGSRGELTFDKSVSVSTRNDRRQLTAAEAIWWPRLGILAVKGGYQLTEDGPPRHGNRAIFNLSLEPITNQQEISNYEQRIQHKVELVAAQ